MTNSENKNTHNPSGDGHRNKEEETNKDKEKDIISEIEPIDDIREDETYDEEKIIDDNIIKDTTGDQVIEADIEEEKVDETHKEILDPKVDENKKIREEKEDKGETYAPGK